MRDCFLIQPPELSQAKQNRHTWILYAFPVHPVQNAVVFIISHSRVFILDKMVAKVKEKGLAQHIIVLYSLGQGLNPSDLQRAMARLIKPIFSTERIREHAENA
jgi:hypothetical protein